MKHSYSLITMAVMTALSANAYATIQQVDSNILAFESITTPNYQIKAPTESIKNLNNAFDTEVAFAFAKTTGELNVQGNGQSIKLTGANSPFRGVLAKVAANADTLTISNVVLEANQINHDMYKELSSAKVVSFNGSITLNTIGLKGNTLKVADSVIGGASAVRMGLFEEQFNVSNLSYTDNHLIISGSTADTVYAVKDGVFNSPRNFVASNNSVLIDNNSIIKNTVHIMEGNAGEANLQIENNQLRIMDSSACNVTGIGVVFNTNDAKRLIRNNAISISNSSIQGGVIGISSANGAATYEGNSVSLIGNRLGDMSVKVGQGNYSDSADVYGVRITTQTGNIGPAIIQNNSVKLHNAKVEGTVYVAGLVFMENINQQMMVSFKGYNDKGKNNRLIASGTNQIGKLDGLDTIELHLANENFETPVVTFTGKEETKLVGKTILAIVDDKTKAIQSGGYKLFGVQQGAGEVTITDSVLKQQSTFLEKETVINNVVLNDKKSELTVSPLPVSPTLPQDPSKPSEPTQPTVLDTSKTLSESLLGSVALVNQGAEFIADEGLRSILNASRQDSLSAFGAMIGGSSKYKTGSHVNLDSMSLVTGVASNQENLTLAGYVEIGRGNSESHVDSTKADGDHSYYGLGIASQYHMNDNLYLNGSLRFGTVKTEFNGQYSNESAHYKVDNLYASAHLGIGYLWQLTESMNVDLYGRYVITYLEGDQSELGTKSREVFDYEDTLTHAFRVGARMSGQACDFAKWYAGLAYEHIADGDAQGKVGTEALGVANLAVPSLSGDSAIVDIGLSMKPDTYDQWQIDLGLKGYAGDRQGVTGNVVVNYTF